MSEIEIWMSCLAMSEIFHNYKCPDMFWTWYLRLVKEKYSHIYDMNMAAMQWYSCFPGLNYLHSCCGQILPGIDGSVMRIIFAGELPYFQRLWKSPSANVLRPFYQYVQQSVMLSPLIAPICCYILMNLRLFVPLDW